MANDAIPTPAGPPSAHVVPLRVAPRVTDTQVIEGHLIDADCPVCGRSEIQHGQYTCAALDAIAARVAYGKLGLLRRLFTRAPIGWALIAAIALTGCTPATAGDTEGETVTVTKVVDGDTVHVTTSGGDDVTVRIIGLDSPETRKPRTPVQCGGPEATAYAKEVLLGQRVQLVDDPTQDSIDRYGRALGYLRLPGGSDYSTEAVRAGVARAYVYDKPGLLADEIQAAEDEARTADRGGWANCGWTA